MSNSNKRFGNAECVILRLDLNGAVCLLVWPRINNWTHSQWSTDCHDRNHAYNVIHHIVSVGSLQHLTVDDGNNIMSAAACEGFNQVHYERERQRQNQDKR